MRLQKEIAYINKVFSKYESDIHEYEILQATDQSSTLSKKEKKIRFEKLIEDIDDVTDDIEPYEERLQQYKDEISRITGPEYRDVHTFE